MAIIPAAFPSLSSRSVASPSSSRHAPDCAPRCAVPRPRRRAALLAGLVAVGVGASASAQSLPELSLTGAFALRHAPGNDVCPRGEELEASTDKVREGQVLALRVERSASHREAATLRVDFEIVTGSGADASDLGSTRRTLHNVALSFPSAFGSTRRCHHVDIAEDGKLEGNEILSIRLKPRAGAYTVKALSGRRDIRIAERGAGIRLRYQEIGTLGRTLSGRRFVLRLEAGVARGGSARNCTFVRDTSFTRSIAMQWRVRDGGRSDLRGATLSDFDLPTRVSFRNGVAEVVGVAKLDGDRESEDFQLEREYAYGSAERYPYPQLYCETAADARRYGLEREFFVLSGVIPPALSAPSAPTGLRATATEDRVRLDWTAASDDSIEGWRYRMRIQGVASWFPVELRSRSAGTRAAVLSFSRYLDGIAMEFQVQSYNAVGSSGWSETAGVVLVNEDTPALRVSERAVDVEAGGTRSWTVAVGGPFAGTVRVESSDPGLVRVSPSELRFTRENARVARTVTVTGLTEGAGDVFHTLTLDGTSVATESDEGTTVAVRVTEGSVRVPDLPRAPRGFRARPGDGEVTLTWSAPGDGSILGYEVRRRHGGPGQRWGEWTAVAGSGAGTTAHTVRGLTNGQKYIFRVRAVNGGGEGRSSRPAGATPMGGVVVAVEDAGVVEGDGGRTYLEFVVTLSGEPVDDVKVRVSALAGSGSTATGTSGTGRDFVPLSETVHFAAYGRKEALLKTVRVEVVGDHRAEGDETFVVRLDELETGDARVALAGGGEKLTATGTIIDDDAAPVLGALADVSVTAGEAVAVTASATDADGDAIGYRWTRKAGETTPALPEGTDLSSARLAFTPPSAGTWTMTVTADDGHGNTDTEEVVVTVAAPADTGVPTGLRVERRNDRLHLSWTAPEDPQRTGWQFRYRSYNGWQHKYFRAWHDWETITDPSARSHTLSSEQCHEGQEFELRATTDAGPKAVASAKLSQSTDWLVFPVGGGGGMESGHITQEGAEHWYTIILRSSVINRMSGPVRVIPVPYEERPGASYFRDPGDFENPTDKVTVYSYGPNYLEFTPKSDWVRADGALNRRYHQVYGIRLEVDEDTRDDWIGIAYRLEGKGLGACAPKYGLIRERFLVRDTTPTLTFGKAPAVVTEGTPIALTLRSDKPISGYLPVSVTLSDRDASGFSAADLPGALTQTFHVHFGGGKTGRLEIPTRADADASEGVEKYTVTLNDITGYAVGEAVTTRGKLKDGPASGYQGFTGATAMTLALTVTPGELEVSEGGTGSYTVVLDEAPADTVTVTPRSGDTAVATVSGALTFTTANWSTPQTVTVTGVRDDDTDDDTVTVTHVAAMGGTALTVTGGDVAVTVVDTTAALANQVHRAVLPQVAAALASQSLDAVAGRIEAVTRGETGRALRLGTVPGSSGAMLETFGAASDELRPVAPTETGLRELLDGASFALPLGAAESGGGAAAPAAVWGRGERVSLSGSEDGVSWDGGLWSAHVGADVRLGPDVVAGAAVSWSEGAFDTEVDDANGRRVKGEYETELLGLHPYGAWLLSGGTHVWASAGYGQGEVRLEEEEGGVSRSVDVTFASAAVGGRGVLGEDAEWIAGGVTRLALRGEGAVSRMKTEAGAGLSALSAHTRRVRLALEGSHERSLAGEATMTPALELGVRHDGGDARDGAGVEAGASVTWRDPSAGLTLEVRSRVLVAHARDRDEWGVGGRLAVEPTVDGHGLYLTLTPSYGHTATDLHGLFERSPVGSYGAGSGVEAAGRLEGEVGYGLGVWGPGRMGVLSPYAGLALSEGGEGSVRLGGRYTLGAALTVSLEGARREESGLEAEDSVMLRASWRW